MNPVPKQHDVTLAEASAARLAVLELLVSQRPERLLIDATAIEFLPKPPRLFDFVKWFARTLPRGARVAPVVRPDQVRHARLIERAARNAGAFLTILLIARRPGLGCRDPSS